MSKSGHCLGNPDVPFLSTYVGVVRGDCRDRCESRCKTLAFGPTHGFGRIHMYLCTFSPV